MLSQHHGRIIEPLERRVLLSFALVGSEFRINSFITGDQSEPAVVMDDDGSFIVSWFGNGSAGESFYSRNYNTSGVAQGAEAEELDRPYRGTPGAFALDDDGDFVMVREDDDGSGYGIFAQRFNAAGVEQGGEIPVNDVTSNTQTHPAVAIDSDGDFVVAWTHYGPGASDRTIFARRYNASGVAQGGAFEVDDDDEAQHRRPAVAMDADGDFIIAWEVGDDGSYDGVRARRFNAAGSPQGASFPVNTETSLSQNHASVAMDSDGDFVIAFATQAANGYYNVAARCYNAAGEPQGDEFAVNTFTGDGQFDPRVAIDSDGDFIIAWSSVGQDGSDYGIYGQRFTLNAEEFATLEDGALVVLGTGGNDTIILARQGQSLRVTRNGISLDFPNADVESIQISADAGNDKVTIGSGIIAASISGGAGNDTMTGGSGKDSLFGEAGNDVLNGGSGNDLLSGGSGRDAADYRSRTAALNVSIDDVANDGVAGETDNVLTNVENLLGGSGNDKLVGSASANHLIGGNGNDILWGLNGNDTAQGDAGNDQVNGGNNDDLLKPGTGRDSIWGGKGTDLASYAERKENLSLTLDNLANDGAAGEADLLKSDIENLEGGLGRDVITGNSLANVIHGNANNDILTGGGGADSIFGDAGNDDLRALDGVIDHLDGGTGTDTKTADPGDVVVSIP